MCMFQIPDVDVTICQEQIDELARFFHGHMIIEIH